MDISRLRKATKIIVPKRIPNFAQKPVYVDIYAQELKFAGDTICSKLCYKQIKNT